MKYFDKIRNWMSPANRYLEVEDTNVKDLMSVIDAHSLSVVLIDEDIRIIKECNERWNSKNGTMLFNSTQPVPMFI